MAQNRHIPSFRRLKKDVFLRAVCDLNQYRAREVAKKFGIPQVYSSLSQMLSKEDLDVVDVCTPPQAHATVAIKSMEGGCHVLLEKPMALNVSDCDEIIEASKKYGVKLSIVHNQRFRPPFLKAQELVENDAIGKLTGMRILSLTHRAEYMADENSWVHRLPSGVVTEMGPHTIYLSLTFVKNVKNVNVCAKKALEYPWVLCDGYNIELEGENMNSSIIISHANDTTANEVDLFGTNGVIRMDLQSMLLMHYKREVLTPLSLALSSLKVAGHIAKGVASNAFRLMLHRPMLGHEIVIEKFVNSIINDQPVPVSADEGRETIRVLEMIVNNFNQKYGSSAPSLKTGRT